MSEITAITPQKRNKDRVNLFLDGHFAFGLSAITAVRLRVGQKLSEADLEQLQQEDDVEQAKEAAVRFISQRPRSTAEVQRKLREKQFDDLTIERVITRLTELELLNDENFANYWREQRETFKPRGQVALRQELLQKGVGREQIDDALQNLDEEEAAYRAIASKIGRWQTLPPQEQFQKMAAFLQRRGFRYDTIRAVANRLQAEQPDTLRNTDLGDD